MDTVYRIIGYVSIPLVLIGVAMAIRSSLRERPLRGRTLLLTTAIGMAFLIVHDLLRAAEVSRPLGWLAAAVGAVLGAVWAGRSRLRSVGGEVVAKGEAWYLAIWGLAVVAAQFSALGPSSGGTSSGIYAVYLATGLMLGVNVGLWARLTRVRQRAVVASTTCPHCGSAVGMGSCSSCGWRVLIRADPGAG
jgi:tellurite resistance protein TehA-like permease